MLINIIMSIIFIVFVVSLVMSIFLLFDLFDYFFKKFPIISKIYFLFVDGYLFFIFVSFLIIMPCIWLLGV